ncbi:MAG: hypothetical protein R3E87_03455 [Burkholderiaceae bacterium]
MQPPVAQAKANAPVSIEYSVPAGLKTGSTATTTIQLVAQSDLQRLVISAAAYSGIELVSGGDQTVIENIKRGESRQIAVNVMLNEPVGYLAVFASTTDSRGQVEHKNIAIRYGSADKVGKRELKPGERMEKSVGETLIIMPAERR